MIPTQEKQFIFPEDGEGIQSPKRCVSKNKQDGFYIKTG
jgi:hypothetical protein